MEAASPLASKRARDGSALRDDAPSDRERAADGACPAKRVEPGPASPARNAAPQRKNDGDAVLLDVEELLLKALEDELEPREKSVDGAAAVAFVPRSASSSWLPNVEEDDNYDESDDEAL